MKEVYLETIKRTLKSTKNSDEHIEYFIECIKNYSNKELKTIKNDLVDSYKRGYKLILAETTLSEEEFDALTEEEKEKIMSDMTKTAKASYSRH